MKHMPTMLAAVIAFLLNASWSHAITVIVPVTRAGALTARGPVTTIPSTQDCVTLKGTAINTQPGSTITWCGPHKAYTDDGSKIGTVLYTGGGSGGIPPKHENGPTSGPDQLLLHQVQPFGLDAGVALGVEGEGYLDENGWHPWVKSWHPGMYWMDEDGFAHTWAQPAGFMGNEFKFMFRDNLTGNWTTYVINIPLVSGTVTFTGSAVSGYGLDAYTDIKIGTFLIGSGPVIPSKSTEYMKSQP